MDYLLDFVDLLAVTRVKIGSGTLPWWFALTFI